MTVKMHLRKEVPSMGVWRNLPIKDMEPGQTQDVETVRKIQKSNGSVTLSDPEPETIHFGDNYVLFIRDESSRHASIIDAYYEDSINTALDGDRFEIHADDGESIISLSYEPTLPSQSRK